MNKIQEITDRLKERNLTWSDLARSVGRDPKNFKRTIKQNLDKIDLWLKEIDLITKIDKKK
jgi:predicted transcriptional regulator